MKFTVVFNSHESKDYSYGLIFDPCPEWVKTGEHLLSLNSDNPKYQLGSIKKLIKKENIDIDNDLISRKVKLIVHDIGNGSEHDLHTLQEDLKNEGFIPNVIYL